MPKKERKTHGRYVMEQGIKLHQLRTFHFKTLEQVAEAIGVAPNTVCDYEHGRARMDHGTLLKVAAYFAVEVEWFLSTRSFTIRLCDDVDGSVLPSTRDGVEMNGSVEGFIANALVGVDRKLTGMEEVQRRILKVLRGGGAD